MYLFLIGSTASKLENAECHVKKLKTYKHSFFFFPCVRGMNQAWAQSKSQAGINKELFCPSLI